MGLWPQEPAALSSAPEPDLRTMSSYLLYQGGWSLSAPLLGTPKVRREAAGFCCQSTGNCVCPFPASLPWRSSFWDGQKRQTPKSAEWALCFPPPSSKALQHFTHSATVRQAQAQHPPLHKVPWRVFFPNYRAWATSGPWGTAGGAEVEKMNIKSICVSLLPQATESGPWPLEVCPEDGDFWSFVLKTCLLLHSSSLTQMLWKASIS